MSSTSTKDQKAALVTGSARGIGKAVAVRLAAQGFAVLVNYVKDDEAAQNVVTTIQKGGGQAIAHRGDVSDPAQVEDLFRATIDAFGRVDALVNNAGILQRTPLAEIEDADFARHLTINVTGTFNTLRAASTHLQDGGRIINMSSSIIGSYPASYGAYAASKGAVEALTHIASKEFGAKGITVNAVAPGPTETEMFYTDAPQPMIDAMVQMTPFKRLGTPEDIAKVVCFLAGPDSDWITGQILRANGGLV